MKRNKCSLFLITMDYLSQVTSPRCLETALHMTNAIQRVKAARNVTEMKWFLSLCNVSRKFVLSFARSASPLEGKIRLEQPLNFELSEKKHVATRKARSD